jgi:hypothetical protein
VFLGVPAGLICAHITPTKFNFDLLGVFFLDIVICIRVSSVLIFRQGISIFLETWFFMNPSFPLYRSTQMLVFAIVSKSCYPPGNNEDASLTNVSTMSFLHADFPM